MKRFHEKKKKKKEKENANANEKKKKKVVETKEKRKREKKKRRLWRQISNASEDEIDEEDSISVCASDTLIENEIPLVPRHFHSHHRFQFHSIESKTSQFVEKKSECGILKFRRATRSSAHTHRRWWKQGEFSLLSSAAPREVSLSASASRPTFLQKKKKIMQRMDHLAPPQSSHSSSVFSPTISSSSSPCHRMESFLRSLHHHPHHHPHRSHRHPRLSIFLPLFLLFFLLFR